MESCEVCDISFFFHCLLPFLSMKNTEIFYVEYCSSSCLLIFLYYLIGIDPFDNNYNNLKGANMEGQIYTLEESNPCLHLNNLLPSGRVGRKVTTFLPMALLKPRWLKGTITRNIGLCPKGSPKYEISSLFCLSCYPIDFPQNKVGIISPWLIYHSTNLVNGFKHSMNAHDEALCNKHIKNTKSFFFSKFDYRVNTSRI